MQRWVIHRLIRLGVLVLVAPITAHAITLPGSADSSRVQAPIRAPVLPDAGAARAPIEVTKSQAPPAGAESLRFDLKGVEVSGATAISPEQLQAIYAPLVGQNVSLAVAWELATKITDQYKQAGYFLSRAYVPAQTIEGGIIKISVVEGFVGQVKINDPYEDHSIVPAWIERIKTYRPITSAQLERALLEMNALPDVSFRAVLSPVEEAHSNEGAVLLTLIAMPKKATGSVRADNYGSRYLGPYQFGFTTDFSLLNGQRTSVSGVASVPSDEMKTLSLRHAVPLLPQVSVDVQGSYTTAVPGYLLKIQEIESKTYSVGVGATYQWLRQRDENLSTRLGVDWRNTDAEILGTPLTRDRLRLLRLNVIYDVVDRWLGYTNINTTLTQGLTGLGASKSGDRNLSRAEAETNFKKLEVTATRLQDVVAGVQAVATVRGQVASGPVSSSEEFGYGGQAFGRAYDNSEITGDKGASAALELRYNGIGPVAGITTIPYAFYDAGIVWNYDRGQPKREHASSAGFGVRARSESGAAAAVGVAFPLTRDASDPIDSKNGRAARFMAEISYEF